jgi:pyrimidine-nucleoside phosphorylase
MNFAEIIEKKKHREELSTDEIKWLISNYITGDVPDYQMASFAMAVWFNQMTSQETSDLTQAMIDSGITYDLSQVCWFVKLINTQLVGLVIKHHWSFHR